MNKIVFAFIALSIVACGGIERGVSQSAPAPNAAPSGTVKQ